MDDPANHGALKVLHDPKDARDPERAHVRIQNEIKAMSEPTHPNLLKILDHDPHGKWYVSQFHPNGSLARNKGRFAGNLPAALRAFRPLVEGVAQLHKMGFVHRDIKPENVFLDMNDNLILGDFGLIFFTDPQHTRVSGTVENVGSRDWMPAWAMGMRVEDVKPTFDVFTLGKLLWAMLANKPMLRLWYFLDPEFNLEQIFPNTPSMRFANALFKKFIVEKEKDCLLDASAMLTEIDKMVCLLDSNADLIGDDVQRRCRACGIGIYEPTERQYQFRTDWLANYSSEIRSRFIRIFTCNHCGNIQLFDFDSGGGLTARTPPAWHK